MKYYVWYNYGSCNDGSHDNGIEEFDSWNAAYRWVCEYRDGALLDQTITSDGDYRIFRGTEVTISEEAA